jgi:hypothetical protein
LLACIVLLIPLLAVSNAQTPAAQAAGGGALWLTGHDADFHCTGLAQCHYLKVALDFVRNGSLLPVLALDHGSEVQTAIRNAYGVTAPTVQTVDPRAAFATTPLTSSAGAPLYSAIVVASDTTCGGCDNNASGSTPDSDAINARATDIANFFSAGGGILALAGAANRTVFYKFVPIPATAVAVNPPFTLTTYGLLLGLAEGTDDNCCPTHNSFQLPAPGSPLKVVETDNQGFAETLVASATTLLPPPPDVRSTANDGIPDYVKINGYGVGAQHIDLPAANVNHKDIYVYLDWLYDPGLFGLGAYSWEPDQSVIDKLVAAFANAPVCATSVGDTCTNPDGTHGIFLHVIKGQGIQETSGNKKLGSYTYSLDSSGKPKDCEYWFSRPLGGSAETVYYSDLEAQYFLSNPSRQPFFHYAIFADQLADDPCGGNVSGISTTPGSNLIIALGRYGNPDLKAFQAASFMHELGHNLGLGHGGIDDAGHAIPDNWKPNHLSVMNYIFQGGLSNGLVNGSQKDILDYSRFEPDALPPLVEASGLDEPLGFKASATLKGYQTWYFCQHTPILVTDITQHNIDWNCDKVNNETGVMSQLDGGILGRGGYDPIPAPHPLTSANEWTHLRYFGPGSAINQYGILFSPPDSLAETPDTRELTLQDKEVLRTLLVPAGSGAVDVVAPPGASILEGNTYAAAGSYSDSNAAAAGWTATVDFGDGSGVQALPLTGTDFTLNHSYGDNGPSPYTVTVVVTDNLGVSGTGTTAVTVNNAPPTATFNASASVNEGMPIVVSLANSVDVAADLPTLQYAFDCGDGSGYGAFGSSNSSTCPTADNGTRTVKGKVRDKDGGLTEYTANVTILNAPPIVSSDRASQKVQYSDTIASVGIAATDVAADMPRLVSTTSFKKDAGSFQTGLPNGLTLTTGGSAGTWTLTGKALVAPGAYTVRVTVTDKDGGAGGTDIGLTVAAEDARVTYAGALFASTASPTSNAATVTLSATLQDITAVSGDPAFDPDAGDIRNATVTFVDPDHADAVLCAAPIGLVSATDLKTGTATCNWATDLGTQDSASFTVGVIVGGFYARSSTSDNTVVTVSKPLTTSFITGGGALLNQTSAGLVPGAIGQKTNFGFNVKHNKGGTNLQGQVNIIVRSGGRTYQIKSNSITSLAANSATGTATFNGKASIQDITDPLTPVSVDGNAILQLTLTDNGEPGTTDTVGITLWNKSGGLWFASRWDGTKTVEEVLSGGNLVVR